jgi:hypothetical protein
MDESLRTSTVCTEFVDETPELKEFYAERRGSVYSPSRLGDKREVTPTSPPTPAAITASTNSNVVSDGSSYLLSNHQSLKEQRGFWSSVLEKEPSESYLVEESGQPVDLQSPESYPHYDLDSTIEVHGDEFSVPSLPDKTSSNSRFFDSRSNFLSPNTHGSSSPTALTISSANATSPQFNIQEACLMRYFIENLACWVSVSSWPIEIILDHLYVNLV